MKLTLYELHELEIGFFSAISSEWLSWRTPPLNRGSSSNLDSILFVFWSSMFDFMQSSLKSSVELSPILCPKSTILLAVFIWIVSICFATFAVLSHAFSSSISSSVIPLRKVLIASCLSTIKLRRFTSSADWFESSQIFLKNRKKKIRIFSKITEKHKKWDRN